MMTVFQIAIMRIYGAYDGIGMLLALICTIVGAAIASVVSIIKENKRTEQRNKEKSKEIEAAEKQYAQLVEEMNAKRMVDPDLIAPNGMLIEDLSPRAYQALYGQKKVGQEEVVQGNPQPKATSESQKICKNCGAPLKLFETLCPKCGVENVELTVRK